ncbi:MAG: metallophosphoesterase [Verrucomicrobia bacterium]|nr:metallophosphoesterase [Verrucomicrobiota bacterium]
MNRVHRHPKFPRCPADGARIAALVFLLTTVWLPAVEPQLLPVAAEWRFHVVGPESPPPAADWRATDFNDAAWPVGLSGFSSIGGEATPLPGTNLTAACFRGRFTLDDPAAVQWLILRMDYVSGFVAYLNGREIARRGVEGDPPPFDAVATPHARNATEEVNVSEHRDALVAGTNVLAIQLHGATTPATQLVLVPELCANFQRGPFVQNVSTQECHILWRTPVPATTVVEYGESPALGQIYSDTTLTTNHVAWLTELAADTEWYYRVRSTASDEEPVSPVYRFRTLRTTGDISFAVFGDSGSGWRSQYDVASCLATAAVDLVLHTGDLAYPNLNRGLADTRCLSVYASQMRGTPFFLTPGNHDLYASDLFATYLETFRMPTNVATGTPHFYSFDHGDAHFVSLFVPTLANFAGMAPYALRPGSAQLQWLTNDLAATTRPWRIVFLHCPLFSSAGHRWDDYDGNGVYDRLELQEWLLPVLSQYGVQVVFSGHDHCYERLAPTNGVHCFVTGGGGYTLYGLSQRDALSQRFEVRFHHVLASITGDSMQIQAVDRYGVIFDEAVIPRVSPPNLRPSLTPPQTLRLEWNAAPGFRYDIEMAETSSGPFTALDRPALPITATNYQAVFELDLGAFSEPSAARFFRVNVLPPPSP